MVLTRAIVLALLGVKKVAPVYNGLDVHAGRPFSWWYDGRCADGTELRGWLMRRIGGQDVDGPIARN